MAQWQSEAESCQAQSNSLKSRIKTLESELLDKNERIKDHELQLSLVAENEAKLTSALSDVERKVAEQATALEQLTHEKALRTLPLFFVALGLREPRVLAAK